MYRISLSYVSNTHTCITENKITIYKMTYSHSHIPSLPWQVLLMITITVSTTTTTTIAMVVIKVVTAIIIINE